MKLSNQDIKIVQENFLRIKKALDAMAERLTILEEFVMTKQVVDIVMEEKKQDNVKVH